MEKHGDGVKDIAFAVEDLDYIVDFAKRRGAVIVRDVWEEKDKWGAVRFATLKTVSDLSNSVFSCEYYVPTVRLPKLCSLR